MTGGSSVRSRPPELTITENPPSGGVKRWEKQSHSRRTCYVLLFPFSPLHASKHSPPQRWFLGCLQIGRGVPRVLGSPRRPQFAPQDPEIALDMSFRPHWCTVLRERSKRWKFRASVLFFAVQLKCWEVECYFDQYATVLWKLQCIQDTGLRFVSINIIFLTWCCMHVPNKCRFQNISIGTQSAKQDYIALIVSSKSSARWSVFQHAFRWLTSHYDFSSASPANVFFWLTKLSFHSVFLRANFVTY